MFASLVAAVFPPPNNPVLGVELPAAAPPNRFGVEDAEVVAGFPNREEPDCVAPAAVFCPPNKEEPVCVLPPACVFWPNKLEPACAVPAAWLLCPPNRPGAGGAPAGVVDGSKEVVLVAAGVAVGVEARSFVSKVTQGMFAVNTYNW